MIVFDTNAMVALLEGTTDRVDEVVRAIAGRGDGPYVVSGPVFAELCAGAPYDVEASLDAAGVRLDVGLSLDVWRVAGRRYRDHVLRRRAAGDAAPRRILADFVIGAHARSLGDDAVFVTADSAFFRWAFPELRVIDPREEKI